MLEKLFLEIKQILFIAGKTEIKFFNQYTKLLEIVQVAT